MPIRRASDAGELYEEVADFDLVIVPDAALASAINRRIDHPHVGHFAITPRRLAARRRERAEDRLAFLRVIHELDHDWRSIAYAIGNVLQCWEHQGRVDAILEYDAYADETARDVVDVLSQIRTTSGQLASFEIPEHQSVAVVGLDHLTTLERSILPARFTAVDLFTDASFDHPAFHIFESASEIIAALLQPITGENAEHVAVVLEPGSRYSPLAEAALEAAEIPFHGGPGFIDDPHHRAFVRLLRVALRGSETLVADVAPVLTQMGNDVSIAHYEQRVAAVDDPGVTWLREFARSMGSQTFEAALRDYERATGISLDRFDTELQELDLSDEPITNDRVDRLTYYLRSYEVPVETAQDGVLLVDAKSSAHVDRPTVFFVGLDQDWTHSAPRRPWVETTAQFSRYIGQFERLLQSGEQQYYLVQDVADGQPNTPCLYFAELLETDFRRFSDLPSTSYAVAFPSAGAAFEREDLDIQPEHDTTLSQSSLNRYVNCPRDYLFDRLLESPARERFLSGTLFHDFAEFYVDHPNVIDEFGITKLVEVMLEEITPFISDIDEPLHRRAYHLGIETIASYLDANPPTTETFITASSAWGENFFAAYFDRAVDSPRTEHWFEEDALGIKGKIDLIQDRDHLIDYKSGSKGTVKDVVRDASIDPISDTPNYQVPLYLTYVRSIQPDTDLRFTFFHFLEPMDDLITGEANIDDALTTVTYHPTTFAEWVCSRDAYDTLLDGYNDCVATFDELGFDTYARLIDGFDCSQTAHVDDLRTTDFAAEFGAAVTDATSDEVDAAKGSDQAIRALVDARNAAFFREDLDAFETFVNERIDEVNRRRAGEERFPVAGAGDEPNYRRVNHRDLLLGERRDG